jgi:hypothetical protein
MEVGAFGVLGHPVQQLATMELQPELDFATTQHRKMEGLLV